MLCVVLRERYGHDEILYLFCFGLWVDPGCLTSVPVLRPVAGGLG